MDETSQDMSGNDNGSGALESLGLEGNGSVEEGRAETNDSAPENAERHDSLAVQKRLKSQKRIHDREMREMQARIAQLQSQLNNNNLDQPGSPNPNMNQGLDDTIHKAVSFALQQKDMEERQAKEAEAQQHIANQYAELNRHLDHVSEQYDDFEDLVRTNSLPYTAAMRDVALLLPKSGPGSAGEVLYKLGKNPDELSRISKLPPVKQASELVALSHALIQGGGQKSQQSSSSPLGQIKSNPIVNSNLVTEKTPVSDIRNRMKKGTFK